MKSPSLAAFLIMGLLAPLAGAVGDETDKPKEEVSAEVQDGASTKDPKVDPETAKVMEERKGKVLGPDGALTKVPDNLPDYAKAAMEKGMTPVMGPDGTILGFDDPVGKMCWMPDAIQEKFGANLPQNPETGATAAGALATAADGAAAATAPGAPAGAIGQGVPPPMAWNEQGPLAPGQIRLPKPEDEPAAPPTPDEKARALDNQIASSANSGDRDGLIEALNARNKNDAETESSSDGGDFASFGPAGADVASTGPRADPISGGGGDSQGIGASGQVGGFGPSGQGGSGIPQGKRVRADAEKEADALLAFQEGLKRDAQTGPSDPRTRSIAHTAQLAANNDTTGGFSGALRWANGLSQRLGFNLGADVEAQGALDDQLGTNPIDGGGASRASIQVVECSNDTLNGTAGGRTSRRIGGC